MNKKLLLIFLFCVPFFEFRSFCSGEILASVVEYLCSPTDKFILLRKKLGTGVKFKKRKGEYLTLEKLNKDYERVKKELEETEENDKGRCQLDASVRGIGAGIYTGIIVSVPLAFISLLTPSKKNIATLIACTTGSTVVSGIGATYASKKYSDWVVGGYYQRERLRFSEEYESLHSHLINHKKKPEEEEF